jgi:hypothetical protein
MDFILSGFPQVIPDNDTHYLDSIKALIEAEDPYSIVAISKTPESFTVRISTSAPTKINPLIKKLNTFHSNLNIMLNWSKSIKASSNITFNLVT